MEAGLQMIFASYGWENVDDAQVYREEVAMGIAAETLGFKTLWPVEHHFFDYSYCPDNLLFLAHMAAATKTINLGTAAIILPWNDPLRVAEKVSMLDNLSNGRMRLGFGRGLSQREFAPFRDVEMGESRERFDEAAPLVVEALETGFFEGDGKYYPTPKIEIRPRPQKSFKNRLYAVANSDDSVDSCAKIGARMVMFAETDWKNRMTSIDRHRRKYWECHDKEAPPLMICDFTYCNEEAELAAERAEKYLASYLASILDHYDLMGEHLAETKGYERYGAQASALREIGFDKYVTGFLASNAYGTPNQILDKLRARYEVVGPFDMATCFRYGGIPFDQAQASMKLFAERIIPEIAGWK